MSIKKIRIIKITMLILFIIIMVLLTVKLVPIFKDIATEEGRINFKSKIEGLGGEGIFMIIRTNGGTNIFTYFARRTCRSFGAECAMDQLEVLL